MCRDGVHRQVETYSVGGTTFGTTLGATSNVNAICDIVITWCPQKDRLTGEKVYITGRTHTRHDSSNFH